MAKIKAYGAKTGQGPYLQVNEDTFDLDFVNDLFMVIDAFGGAGIGDALVLEIKEWVKQFYLRFGGDVDATMPFYYSYRYLLEGNALVNALHYAHKKVLEKNRLVNMDKRGGASGVFGAFSKNLLTLVMIGNLKSFLVRNGQMTSLFVGDSLIYLCQDLVHESHFKTCPMNAIGLFDDLNYQIMEIRPLENDLLIFLTDGAFSRSQEQEIRFIVEQNDLSLNKKIDKIFELNNSRGNLDNQTGLILQF